MVINVKKKNPWSSINFLLLPFTPTPRWLPWFLHVWGRRRHPVHWHLCIWQGSPPVSPLRWDPVSWGSAPGQPPGWKSHHMRLLSARHGGCTTPARTFRPAAAEASLFAGVLTVAGTCKAQWTWSPAPSTFQPLIASLFLSHQKPPRKNAHQRSALSSC